MRASGKSLEEFGDHGDLLGGEQSHSEAIYTGIHHTCTMSHGCNINAILSFISQTQGGKF